MGFNVTTTLFVSACAKDKVEASISTAVKEATRSLIMGDLEVGTNVCVAGREFVGGLWRGQSFVDLVYVMI